jgi:hypothetical protein
METAFASNLIKYLELLAGITGLLCYYKKQHVIWLAFAIFLICLFGMEELGTWFTKNKMYDQNTFLYKWVVIPSLFTMYHIVYYYIAVKKIRLFVLASGILLLLLALFENVVWSEKRFFSITLTVSYGCLSVLILSLTYFFQLIKSEDILHFKRLMPFWFCLGLFVFYLGAFPYLALFNSMSSSKNNDVSQFFRWVFIALNWIMYILFTIGFIWSKPKSQHL